LKAEHVHMFSISAISVLNAEQTYSLIEVLFNNLK